jgi:hypothetical protein
VFAERDECDAADRAADTERNPRGDAFTEEDEREQGDGGRDARHDHAGRERRAHRHAE